MPWDPRPRGRLGGALCALGLLAAGAAPAVAADHGDMPQLAALGRSDAMLTDLHVFRRGDRLVLCLCTNPAIPPEVAAYTFSSDLTLRIHIDNESPVRFDDPVDLIRFGGTVVHPEAINDDILLEITFDHKGRPKLKARGIQGKFKNDIILFTGLRDDPFIRRPRIGRNVAAVVVEVPLEGVLDDQPTLLVWATSEVPEVAGPVADHAGRALRSMFIEEMNEMPPSEQWLLMGLMPDVVIFDARRPDRFPNGRALTDDVVDLVVDMPGPLPGEAPDFPTQNDVPFLPTFPYLAPPHPPR